VNHALLGVSVETAWAEEGVAEYPVGLSVVNLLSESAYETSGGQVNDVIIEFEGLQITARDQLLAQMRRHRAGDVVEIRILRADDEQTLRVELGSLSG
jgi:S1-C subfamily serine protease